MLNSEFDSLGLDEIQPVLFIEMKVGEKFATVANRKIVVWTKIRDGRKFLQGQTDDGWTCPVENAITDTGFSAVFEDSTYVMLVDTNRDF